ncbi:MAG TPA: pilus assembly protein TadG-related protein, partial [Pirellulaceae bacterium]|nr:pilus assembly protein TadG-related protein [Pirellulaceae bacterium]
MPRKSFKRPGAIALLTAVVMVVLLVCVAIAIDVGAIVLVKTQLQSASDSAALASATRLGYGQAAIIAEAQTYAGLNKQLGGASAEINANEVEIGVWNRAARTF